MPLERVKASAPIIFYRTFIENPLWPVVFITISGHTLDRAEYKRRTVYLKGAALDS